MRDLVATQKEKSVEELVWSPRGPRVRQTKWHSRSTDHLLIDGGDMKYGVCKYGVCAAIILIHLPLSDKRRL